MTAPAIVSDASRRRDRVRLLLGTVTSATEKVGLLLEEAQAAEDHLALGYTSWTAYVAGEYHDALAGLSAAFRRPAVHALAEGGLSSRVIAEIAGVGQSTVARDLQVTHCGSPGRRVVGRDGKSYEADRRSAAVPSGDVPSEYEIGEMLARIIEELYELDPDTWAAPHDLVDVIRILWPFPTHPQHVAHRTIAYEITMRCPADSPVWKLMGPWLFHVAGPALLEYADLGDEIERNHPGRRLAELWRVVWNPELTEDTRALLQRQLEGPWAFALHDCERYLSTEQTERCGRGQAGGLRPLPREAVVVVPR